jgi:hypothetical protein
VGWRNGGRRKSQAEPKGGPEGGDEDASLRIGQKVERQGWLKAQAGDKLESQLENLTADESWRVELEGRAGDRQAARVAGRSEGEAER